MLPIIFLALIAIVVVFAGIVAMQPSEFRVARTTTISAPASSVFAQVNDFHKWENWNPWGKIDPAMKQTYEGAPSGIGAIYTWTGNAQVGEGRMTLTESRPSDLIKIKLEFLKPFAATSLAEFTFKPEGDQTVVTWSMIGQCNFIAKTIHLFISMDKMIGGQFEKGLARMKAEVEAAPAQ
jgi:polyketide cyclase/dehydrase/lipid transport protein